MLLGATNRAIVISRPVSPGREASEPRRSRSRSSILGRVAVAYVQGLPKGDGAWSYVPSSERPAFRPGVFMDLLVFWIIMAGVVAMIANARGQRTGNWFIYGLAIWPIALVHILLTAPSASSANGSRTCPDCAEVIKADAKVCRYCGARDLAQAQPTDRLGRIRYDAKGRPDRRF